VDDELPPLLRSLHSAVAATPGDVPLRVHLAEQLLAAGRPQAALEQVSAALAVDPGDPGALACLQRVTGVLAPAPAATPTASPVGGDADEPSPRATGFDWSAAEEQVADLVEPAFITGPESDDPAPAEMERPTVTLADVAGLRPVKERLESSFLTPLRNPELRRLYGASLRGGLLLYGPPGCGKTFLARALAGELAARFYAVGIAEVLDMWVGSSERNLHAVFQTARRNAPCVLFLDEVDALGQKRSQLRSSPAMRGVVNQLLAELDSVESGGNDGVFVLAATNAPWDVDAALKRPGRLDRAVLVLPPDLEAREAVLVRNLRDRPLEGVDVRVIARTTEGWSGADLAVLCERAAQSALSDSVRTGRARPVRQADLLEAVRATGSSLEPWYETAASVAQFANNGGEYDDLLAHLKSRRRL